ncbi:MAG: sensor histidine kinase [Gammaproteobacteria bacterium]|nr:sensor histidine kinase [Gammaproteobacteria bacterium]
MSSLQRQLRHNLFWSLLLVMAGVLILVDGAIKEITRDYVLSRLGHDAESVMTLLDRVDGVWQLHQQRLSTVYERVNSGHYYIIQTPTQELRSRSLWDHEPQLHPPRIGEVTEEYQQEMGGQRWLTRTQTILQQGEAITIWVAEDISDLITKQLYYRYAAITLLGLSLLLLLTLQQRLVQRAFSRLDPLREMIRAMHSGALEQSRPDLPDEVHPLLEEIERLLQQLGQRVTRSRNALGNLAHEMKRPLQQLQLLTEALPPEQRLRQEPLLQQLRQKMERELKRARIVGVSSPGRHTVLQREIPALLEVLHHLYPHCTLHSHYPPDGVMPQDRDDMLELLGNLLDNACRYAGGEVDLHLTPTSGGWQITIRDHGPGIPLASQITLLQRGQRLDEHGVAGSGLGLAICRDIVETYNGKLTLNPTTHSAEMSSGLTVAVTLGDPLAKAANNSPSN